MKTRTALLLLLIGYTLITSGGLFKIMHWPGANMQLLIGATIQVLALLALAGVWFIAAREVEAQVAAWTERQRAAGILFTHGEIDLRGFPFRIDLTIPDPSLASADGRRRWEGAAIHATASLWHTGRFAYETPGRHRYRFTGLDGAPHEITFDLLAAAGQVALQQDRIRAASLAAAEVRISGTAPGEVSSLRWPSCNPGPRPPARHPWSSSVTTPSPSGGSC